MFRVSGLLSIGQLQGSEPQTTGRVCRRMQRCQSSERDRTKLNENPASRAEIRAQGFRFGVCVSVLIPTYRSSRVATSCQRRRRNAVCSWPVIHNRVSLVSCLQTHPEPETRELLAPLNPEPYILAKPKASATTTVPHLLRTSRWHGAAPLSARNAGRTRGETETDGFPSAPAA